MATAEFHIADDSHLSDDDLFTHLSELCDQLPVMQEKGKRLQLARQAAHLDELYAKMRTCQAQLDSIDERFVPAKEEFERTRDAAAQTAGAAQSTDAAQLANDAVAQSTDAARSTDAAQAAETAARLYLFYGEQRGYYVAPAKMSREAYEEALAASPFDDEEGFRAALLPQDELDALEAELASFAEDYKNTLLACEKIEETRE